MHIEVNSVKYESLVNEKVSTNSETIKQRVNLARDIQVKRYKKYGFFSNSELAPNLIEKYCKLNTQSQKLLNVAFNNLGLSARAYSRILRVARTIADLEQSTNIETKHIAEAIQYRNLDRKYWGG